MKQTLERIQDVFKKDEDGPIRILDLLERVFWSYIAMNIANNIQAQGDGAMNSTKRKSNNFIIRRPLLAYFVLSCAFFWGFLILAIVILGMLRLQPDTLPAWAMPIVVIFGSWMPNLAALTVTGVLAGRKGIRQLLGKFLDHRIAVRWYLAALFPFPLAFVAVGLYRLAGETAARNMGLSVGFWVGLIILNLLQGATGEEAGWRGFALPRLQETYGPVRQV